MEGCLHTDCTNLEAPTALSTQGAAKLRGSLPLFPVCMVPLTPHALLRARIVPSGFPLLHLGADYIAQLRIGNELHAPLSKTDPSALQRDLGRVGFTGQTAKNGNRCDAANQIEEPVVTLTSRTGCLSVLQRRCLLLEQQLEQLNKRINSTQLVLGDTGLWAEAAPGAVNHDPSASLQGASSGHFCAVSSTSTSSVRLTPEGFFEIREDITDEGVTSPQFSCSKKLEVDPAPTTAKVLHVMDSGASPSGNPDKTAWRGGVRDAIVERDTHTTKGGSVQQKRDRPESHFKRLMMQQRSVDPSL